MPALEVLPELDLVLVMSVKPWIRGTIVYPNRGKENPDAQSSH